MLKEYKFSKEHRRKISESHKGQKRLPFSEKTRLKMSLAQTGNQNNLGKHLSEETKHKIGVANKAKIHRPLSEEHKKKIGVAGKGRIITEEHRRKIGDANRGKKSAAWKGGITPENIRIRNSMEYKAWDKAVFIRDNYTDQKTGTRGGVLHAHHILNFAEYPELRFDINNGITLSKEAHEEFHKKYGKTKNTKEQLAEFLIHA